MVWWLAQHTLMATVLAGIVALLCRWGRIGPALQHGLWLIVLLKLLVPPFVAWPWALPLVSPSSRDTANSQLVVTGVEDENAVAGELQELFLVDAQAHGSYKLARTLGDEPQKIGATSSQEESPAWRIPEWVGPVGLTIWVAGSVAMAVFQFVRIVKFRRLLKRGRTPPSRLVRQVQELATVLAVRRPGTRVVPGIGSPFVWGLHRAQLLWPTAFLGRLADTCWRSVIAHELAHLRRRDHWVAWLQLLAECVWWWNPLFWYVRRQLRLNAELACDAWVVSALPEERRAYAEALIAVTEHVSQTASLAPALGISSGARQAFERRLTMIMGERVPCKVPIVGLVVMGLLGLAAIPGWAQVQAQALKASEPAKKESSASKIEVLNLAFLNDQDLQVQQAPAKDEVVIFKYALEDAAQKVASAKSAGDSVRDQKLGELEARIAALLNEVQNLRSAGGTLRFRVIQVAPESGPVKDSEKAGKAMRVTKVLEKPFADDLIEARVVLDDPKVITAPAIKADNQSKDQENIRVQVISPHSVKLQADPKASYTAVKGRVEQLQKSGYKVIIAETMLDDQAQAPGRERVESTKTKGDPERDRKLRELEKKIEALLKEVQNLRSAGTGDAAAIQLQLSQALSAAGQKKEIREVPLSGVAGVIQLQLSEALSAAGQKKEIREIHKVLTLTRDKEGAPAAARIMLRVAPETAIPVIARLSDKTEQKPTTGENIQYKVIARAIQVAPEIKTQEHKAIKVQVLSDDTIQHKPVTTGQETIKVQVLSDDTNKQKAVTKGTYKIEVEPKQELHVIKGDVQVPIVVGKLAESPQLEKKRVLLLDASQGEQAQTLSRVTYKLSHEKAEALAAFLRENVKGSVVETKVTEGGLVITTTPEVQHTIAGIVALLRSKTGETKGGRWEIQFNTIQLDNNKAIIIDNGKVKKK